MTSVLAFIEHEDGVLRESSRKLLTFARCLAERHGADLEVATIGPVDDAGLEVVREQGTARATVVVHDLLAEYTPAGWAEALAQLIPARDPRVVVAAATDRGNEVMAHVAARLDLPLAANCLEVEPEDPAASPDAVGTWSLTRQRWGGVLLEDARLQATTALVTVVPHAVTATAASSPGPGVVVDVAPELDDDLVVDRVRERVGRTEGVSLATAPVVVSGGRGVGSAEGFAPLEELAALLGGAVGCSRVATNNGWRSHADQVGQTGTRVAPDLYIALGISGATQHWVGCMGSKRILAVNTDAEAPLVTRADYAVVGDLHELLPALVDEVRRRKGVA